MQPFVRLSIAMCCVLVVSSHRAHGDSLRTIVERGMIAPGSNREFSTFGQLNGVGPAIRGRRVAFFGLSPLGPKLFVWSEGALELIAATNVTIVPGTEDVTFRNFGTLGGASPSISGENVAFASLLNAFQNNARPGAGAESEGVAGESAEEQGAFASGVYAYINGELRVIADTDTIVPGVGVTFVSFGVIFGVSPSISGENVVFFGEWLAEDLNTERGIWAYIDGSFELIAQTGEPTPDGGLYGGFGFLSGYGPSISGENVAFHDGSAVYARIDGELRLIANTSSDPGASAQQIGPFVAPHISGENVVFAAGNPSGIYTYIDSSLKRVVDTSTVIPGHDVVFQGVLASTEPSISGTNIAFSGGGIGTNGVYVLIREPPAVPGQSDCSVIGVTLLLLAAASAIIVRPPPLPPPGARYNPPGIRLLTALFTRPPSYLIPRT